MTNDFTNSALIGLLSGFAGCVVNHYASKIDSDASAILTVLAGLGTGVRCYKELEFKLNTITFAGAIVGLGLSLTPALMNSFILDRPVNSLITKLQPPSFDR